MFLSILLDMLCDLDRGCLEVCVILSAKPLLKKNPNEEIILLITSSSEMSISIVNALPSIRTMTFFASFMQAAPSCVLVLLGLGIIRFRLSLLTPDSRPISVRSFWADFS
jgi:hypothetical protein